jgi:hypothetical protein
MENKQVDLKQMSKEELWRIAFEQQEVLTSLLAQIQQIQANITLIKDELNGRVEPEPEKKK